jgi:hypothetical protein
VCNVQKKEENKNEEGTVAIRTKQDQQTGNKQKRAVCVFLSFDFFFFSIPFQTREGESAQGSNNKEKSDCPMREEKK